MTLARRLRNTWRELFGVSLKPAPWLQGGHRPKGGEGGPTMPPPNQGTGGKRDRGGWDMLEDWSAWEVSGTGRCPFCSRPYEPKPNERP